MSTTFAVRTWNPLKTTEVAHRYAKGKKAGGGVGITWLSKKKFSPDTKVVPLDNTAQGVETYGDLIKLSIDGKL